MNKTKKETKKAHQSFHAVDSKELREELLSILIVEAESHRDLNSLEDDPMYEKFSPILANVRKARKSKLRKLYSRMEDAFSKSEMQQLYDDDWGSMPDSMKYLVEDEEETDED